MKIISPFKDYYDHVAGRYGGGDPKVVYERGIVGFGKRRDSGAFERVLEQYRDLSLFHSQFFYKDGPVAAKPIDRALLIVAGKCFPLIDSRENPAKGATWKIDLDMMERRAPVVIHYMIEKYPEFGIECEPWVALCKAERAPVFILWRSFRRAIMVEHLVPKLDKLGLPALISAEQAYQQIAYYVGNICRESVDVKPPVEVSNKDKIVGHGFDLITSFRGKRV